MLIMLRTKLILLAHIMSDVASFQEQTDFHYAENKYILTTIQAIGDTNNNDQKQKALIDHIEDKSSLRGTRW